MIINVRMFPSGGRAANCFQPKQNVSIAVAGHALMAASGAVATVRATGRIRQQAAASASAALDQETSPTGE